MTSGGYGYRIGRSIALAYVRADLARPGTAVEVEILGERRDRRSLPRRRRTIPRIGMCPCERGIHGNAGIDRRRRTDRPDARARPGPARCPRPHRRPSRRSRRADTGDRRAGANARDPRPEAGLAAPAVAHGARTAAPACGRTASTRRIPVGDIGRDLRPVPVHPDAGPGRDRATVQRGARRARHGRAVARKLVQLVQHDDHVVATLRAPDGSQLQVRALWVAGCDGSRSSVREFCGIGFPGAPYEHVLRCRHRGDGR